MAGLNVVRLTYKTREAAVTDVESTNQLVLFWSPAGSTLLERPLTIPAVLEGNGRVLLTGSGDNGDPLTPDFTAEVYHK